MQKIILCLCLALGGIWPVLEGAAQAGAQPVVVGEVSLEKLSKGKNEAVTGLGDGFSVQIFSGPGANQQNLVVSDHGQKVKELESGRFIDAVSFEAGPSQYWVISGYSGGVHCCGVYFFFSRPDKGRALRYLGETPGHNGGPLRLKGAILFRQGQIFFASLDNRFDYFHESHAGSLLVNLTRVFYRLSPDSLRLDNTPFKEGYLKAAARVDEEIAKETANRRGKPEAILAAGFGRGYDSLNFADPLGQLLVKRTVLYLYAREDARAWQSLDAGIKKYYRTARWLPELRREILAKLKESPY